MDWVPRFNVVRVCIGIKVKFSTLLPYVPLSQYSVYTYGTSLRQMFEMLLPVKPLLAPPPLIWVRILCIILVVGRRSQNCVN